MTRFESRDLFGGRGLVQVCSLLDAPMEPFQQVLDCELEPFGRVGEHHQEFYPELVIVTGGEGLARVDGVEQQLTVGSLVRLPLGSRLEIRNTVGVPLHYLIIKAR